MSMEEHWNYYNVKEQILAGFEGVYTNLNILMKTFLPNIFPNLRQMVFQAMMPLLNAF